MQSENKKVLGLALIIIGSIISFPNLMGILMNLILDLFDSEESYYYNLICGAGILIGLIFIVLGIRLRRN